MSKRTDSNLYTVLFAAGMVLVVGALLAFFASALKPTINENKRIEKQQNILYAMGVNENDETSAIFVSKDKVADVFAKYITKQLVIQGSKVTEDAKAYLIDVKKEQTSAKEGNERRLPLFVGEKDGNTFELTYQTLTVLNTQNMHGVEPPTEDRLLFRVATHDVDFEDVGVYKELANAN